MSKMFELKLKAMKPSTFELSVVRRQLVGEVNEKAALHRKTKLNSETLVTSGHPLFLIAHVYQSQERESHFSGCFGARRMLL